MSAPGCALAIEGLNVSATSATGQTVPILQDVSFTVARGRALGLIGESGSGKTMTSHAIMRLLPRGVRVTSGTIRVNGRSILELSAREMRKLRGQILGMVLQDPMNALDPCFSIGDQLAEALRLHRGLRGSQLRSECVVMLERVRIPSATQRLRQYPHELSGGMRQRVCSAIALSGRPEILIADEPTTALDVTTQHEYLLLLKELQSEAEFTLMMITHDLSIIREMCSEISVMYAGEIVESGSIVSILRKPQHPYTQALFSAVPSLDLSAGLVPIEGQAPEPSSDTMGCRFAPRCSFAREVCNDEHPNLAPRGTGGVVARCHGTEPGGWITEMGMSNV